jgi:hypothetical protein
VKELERVVDDVAGLIEGGHVRKSRNAGNGKHGRRYGDVKKPSAKLPRTSRTARRSCCKLSIDGPHPRDLSSFSRMPRNA